MVQRHVSAWAWNLLQKTILIKRTSDFHSPRKQNSSVGPSFYCRSRKNWNLNTLLTLLNFSNLKTLAGSARLFGSPGDERSMSGAPATMYLAPWPEQAGPPRVHGESYNRARSRRQYPLPRVLWYTQEGMRWQLVGAGYLFLGLRWHCCSYCIN